MGTIFIDRSKTSARIALIKESTNVFKKGYSICLLPEGTRSIDGNLLEPNMALIKLCYKLGVSVVPAAIQGSIDVMRKHEHFFNPFKKIVLKYNPPVFPKDYENIDSFTDACWEKVKTTHEELKRDYFSK
jgi:1-acyl-sn-glycerol-3-phosphate acyltransferase